MIRFYTTYTKIIGAIRANGISYRLSVFGIALPWLTGTFEFQNEFAENQINRTELNVSKSDRVGKLSPFTKQISSGDAQQILYVCRMQCDFSVENPTPELICNDLNAMEHVLSSFETGLKSFFCFVSLHFLIGMLDRSLNLAVKHQCAL